MSVIPALKGRDGKPSFKASLSYIVSLRQTSAISDLVTKDSLSFSPSLLPSPTPASSHAGYLESDPDKSQTESIFSPRQSMCLGDCLEGRLTKVQLTGAGAVDFRGITKECLPGRETLLKAKQVAKQSRLGELDLLSKATCR